MKGSIPDTQDETGRTGLHQAAVKGDVEEVGLLLSAGANPNIQDAHLQTPVTLAAERGLHGVVKVLAEHDGTEINLQDSFGRTPLHWCAKSCDVKVAEALLGPGKASANVKTTGGDTALHWACSADGGGDHTDRDSLEERSLRVAELLIRAGADVRAKNGRGETPMDVARNEMVLALLLSAAQELDKREEEEADEADRKSALAAQSELDTATTSARGSASGWPAKQQPGAGNKAFSKQGVGTSVVAGAGGAKKKLVIKLKKKP
eukprot:g10061.t2